MNAEDIKNWFAQFIEYEYTVVVYAVDVTYLHKFVFPKWHREFRIEWTRPRGEDE